MPFWEYQTRTTYNRRQRRLFEQQARSRAFNETILPQLAQRTAIPPTLLRRLPTARPDAQPITDDDVDAVTPKVDLNKIPESFRAEAARKMGIDYDEPKKRGGILGLAGEVTEAVGLDDIQQPWDILRPVKRLMDAEQRYIAKPVAEEIYRAGPITKALGLDYDVNDSVPGLVRFGTEVAVSPSTWLGPGTALNLIKGARSVAWAAPTIASMAVGPGSRRALTEVFTETIRRGGRMPPIGGGSGTSAFDEMVERFNKLGDDSFNWESVDDAILHAQRHRSYTQVARGALDKLLTPQQNSKILDTVRKWTRTGIEDIAGIRLFDGPIGPLIGHYQKVINMGNSASTIAIDAGLRIALKRAAIPVDSKVEMITDPGLVTQAFKIIPGYQTGDPLFIEDFIKYADRFNLNKQQKMFVEAFDQEFNLHRSFEKAARVPIKDQKLDPDLRYVHKERIKQPVEIGQYDEFGRRTGSTTDSRTLGQVVNARMGGRQSASLPNEFETKLAGWKSGIEYLPFFEGQRSRMMQGYKLIADKYLDNALDQFGRTTTELLDPQLTARASEISKLRGQGVNIARRLDEAIRHSNARTGSWRKLNSKFYAELPPQLKSIVDRAEHVSSSVSKAKLRENDLKALRDELGAFMEPVVKQHTTAAKEIADAKARINAFGSGEYSKRFGGRFYDPKLGNVLERELAPLPASGIERGIQAINDLARPLMATLDASFLGIQGLVAFSHNPKAWFTAFENSMFGGYDTYIEKAAHTGLLDDFRKVGGFFAAKNDFGDFITPPIVSKLPIAGKAAAKSGEWWTNFGNVLRLEMYKNAAFMKSGMTRADKEGLAKLVNNATGYSATPLTRLERIGEFAPRFFRSQFGVLADAITKGGVTGAQAKRMVTQLVGEGLLLTYMVNEFSDEVGLGGSELDWTNPGSSNFLKMRVLGRDVSIFGPWESLAKIAIHGIPYDFHDKEFDVTKPFEGVAYAARTKASPVMGRIYDIIDGETFIGEPVTDFSSPTAIAESLANIAKSSLLPISVQSLINEGDFSDWRTIPATAIEVSGVRINPLSDYENLDKARNDLAQSNYQRDWEDLEPYEQQEIYKNNPDLEEIAPNKDQAYKQLDALQERFQRQQERIDERYTGKDWLDQYHKNMENRAGAYGQWEADFPEAAARQQAKKPKNAEEAARKQYYDFFRKANEEALLPEEIAEGVQELMDNFTPSQREFIERNTGLKNTPKVARYREAQKVLKEYWRVDNTIWSKLKENGRVDEETYDDFIDNLTQDLLQRGTDPQLIGKMLDRHPIVRRMNQAVNEARQRLRLQNQAIDSALVEWYEYDPIELTIGRGPHRPSRPSPPGRLM